MARLGIYTVAGEHQLMVDLPAHSGGAGTEEVTVGWAGAAATLTGAYHIPDTAVTGASTDYTELNLIDCGTDGSGTTEIAHIDYSAGTDTAACDARALLTGALTTFTAYDVDEGAVIKLQYAEQGSGLTLPAGSILFTFEPR